MAELSPEPQTSHEMLISNLSLPLPVQIAGGFKAVEDYTHTIGATGLELTPSKRGLFMGLIHGRLRGLNFQEAESQRPDLYVAEGDMGAVVAEYSRNRDWTQTDLHLTNLIRSYHASPRDATAPGFDLLGKIMFPHFEHSFDTMSAMQQVTGPLPGVVYPYYHDRAVSYKESNPGFSMTRFQPMPHDWHRMGLAEHSLGPAVFNAMRTRGLGEITWDVFHSQNEQAKVVFEDPLGLCSRLASAGLIASVHLALDRRDSASNPEIAKRTQEAKQAFVTSEAAARRTLEGEMLQEIASQWKAWGAPYRRNIVVETLPQISTKQSAREHAAIIENAQLIIASV